VPYDPVRNASAYRR